MTVSNGKIHTPAPACAPTTDLLPRKSSNRGERAVAAIGPAFESPDLEQLASIIEVHKKLAEELERECDPIDLPAAELSQLAIDPVDDAPEQVRVLAECNFDSNASRARRKSGAKKVQTVLRPVVSSIPRDLARWKDVKLNAVIIEKVPSSKPGHRRLPTLVWLVTLLLLGITSAFAEIFNARSLVVMAGLEFEGADFIGPICFSWVFVFGTFLLFKFALHGLVGRTRVLAHRGLRVFGPPCFVAGIFLFAAKMGMLTEVTDIFSAATGWQPPMWLLIASSMLLLATGLAVLPVLLEGPIKEIWPVELKTGQTYAFASSHERQWATYLGEAEALDAQMTELLAVLNSEKKAYVARCLAEYARCRANAESAIANARLQILKAS